MAPQGALGTASGRAAGEGWRAPGCRLDVDCGSARVRSHKISLSSSANSSPAMARPAGVIGPRASVRETKPTPRCSLLASAGGRFQSSPSRPDCFGLASLCRGELNGADGRRRRAGRSPAWPGVGALPLFAKRELVGRPCRHTPALGRDRRPTQGRIRNRVL